MKLLSVIASADRGGAEVHLVHIVSTVRAEHLIVTLADGPLTALWEKAGARVVILPAPGKTPLLAAARLRTLVKKENPGVIHSHTPKANLLAALAAGRTPFAMTIHGGYRQFVLSRRVPSVFFRASDRFAARSASAVIAVCETDRRMLEAAGFPRTKLVTIPNGIPDPGVSRAPASGYVTWIGRFSPEKRPELMLDVATRLAARGVKNPVRMIGRGDSRAGLLTRAAELNTGINFIEDLPDLRSVWPETAVLINTSASEGASLTIIEAMAAGIPVVASANGGNPELLFGSGVAVEDRDSPAATAEALTREIVAVLENASMRRRLARGAREKYEVVHQIGAMAMSLEGVYSRLAKDQVLD